MTVKRMDNVGIVVQDIDAAIEFFTELGLELEGRAPIEGDWADDVTGLRDMRVEIAMMRASGVMCLWLAWLGTALARTSDTGER
jgi:hypothetical protein